MNSRTLGLLTLLLCFATSSRLISQTTLLTTQAEIDAFNQSFLPGDLEIRSTTGANAIVNLDGLSVLTRIGGTLEINNNSSLTDIDGLANLTTIDGSISLDINPILTNLDGLSSLTSVFGSLSISRNEMLEQINGLSSLTSLGEELWILNNSSLTSLTGLDNIVNEERDCFIYENQALINMDIFLSLSNIAGRVYIEDNDALVSLSCFSNLSAISGALFISQNDGLQDISELSNINSITGDLGVHENQSLTEISNLTGLDDILGTIVIWSNPALSSLDGLRSLTSITGLLSIENNESLSQIDGMRNIQSIDGILQIQANPLLGNLNGLRGLKNINGFLEIFENGNLDDCCGLAQILNRPHLISGIVFLSGNPFPCSSAEEIVTESECELLGLNGSLVIDADKNGCDSLDPIYKNYQIEIAYEDESFTYQPFLSGRYFFPIAFESEYTITPEVENAQALEIDPPSITLTLGPDETYYQDFCIDVIEPFFDLSVYTIPIDRARPGFETTYKLCYKNSGVEAANGSVEWTFEGDVMEILSTSITPSETFEGRLVWEYEGLQPSEERCIEIVVRLNSPMDTPPLNGNEILDFRSSILPLSNDAKPKDNNHLLSQEVVNSFDPNDKTCLTGDELYPEEYEGFVDYMIRFENKGTAEAVNIAVVDSIDADKFDISTLEVLSASHECQTITEGDVVTFEFKNINLPFDDESNDGYIIFRIETYDDIELGDQLLNAADIYFDFNFPIRTNTATSVYTLMSNIYEVEQTNLSIYPVPAHDMLFIHSKLNSAFEYSIHDMQGREVLNGQKQGDLAGNSVAINNLVSGMYRLTLDFETGQKVSKLFNKIDE